jgi:hypothetical protein
MWRFASSKDTSGSSSKITSTTGVLTDSSCPPFGWTTPLVPIPRQTMVRIPGFDRNTPGTMSAAMERTEKNIRAGAQAWYAITRATDAAAAAATATGQLDAPARTASCMAMSPARVPSTA